MSDESFAAITLHVSKVVVPGVWRNLGRGLCQAGAATSPVSAGVRTRCSPGSLVRIGADLG
ncbi:MAG TPA: hypothetical protein VFU48_05545 [Nitrospira sp.]|nr:hypothetical protein [Nitrospira sp.]